jgi:putative alpha-1,2-mannosidase
MYDDLSSGGELELIMGPEPNRLWGSGEKDVPITGLE